MKKIIHYYPRAFVGNGGVTIAVWKILNSLKKNYELYIAYDQNLLKKQPLEIKEIKKIPTKHYLSGKFQIPSNFLIKILLFFSIQDFCLKIFLLLYMPIK